MKQITRKIGIFALAIVLITSLFAACALTSRTNVSADLENLATNAENWQGSSMTTYGEEGFKFAPTTDDGYAVVTIAASKTKISANSTVTVKYKATANLANIMMQFKDTRDTVPTGVGYSDGGAGYRLLVHMRGTASFDPNYAVNYYLNDGNWFADYANGNFLLVNEAENKNSSFDEQEHTITIKTEDLDNGIKFSVFFSAISGKVENQVIENEALKGDYYLAFGCRGYNAGSYFQVTSVTVENNEPEVPEEKDFSGNIAVKSNQWQLNDGKATISDNGIAIATEEKYESNVSVALKNKIETNAEIKIKFKATASLANFLVQFADTRSSVPAGIGYVQGGNGHRIILDLRRDAGYSPHYGVIHYQNEGHTYPDGFVYAMNDGNNKNEFFDGEEHVIYIKTTEAENGVKVSIKVDDSQFVSEKVLEDEGLAGDYYLAIGCLSLEEASNLTITSVEINEIGEIPPVVLPDIDTEENLLTDAYGWVPNKDGVTFDENGLTVPAGNQIGTSYKNRITANSTLDMYFQGVGAKNNSCIYLIFKDNSDLREGQSSVQYGAKHGSRRIAIEITGEAMFFWDYTMTDDVNTWAQGAKQIGSVSTWYLDGNLHRLNVVTEDTDNGIKFVVSMDNSPIFSKEIENAPELKGDYDLTIKVGADSENEIKVPVLTATGAAAIHKVPFVRPEYDKDKYNLATDYYSWVMGGGVSIGKVEMDDNGMTFSNTANCHAAAAALKTTRVKDYKVSMLFNSSLNPPTAEESGDSWRYSYIELVCKTEMSNCTTAIACPYGGGVCYYSFRMGWESQRNNPGNTCFGIFKHRGYSTGTPLGFTMNRTDINITDGKDHWLEMTVRDVKNAEGVGGVNIIISLDGDIFFDYVDYDKVVTEEVDVAGEKISVDYNWKASGMNGWIGVASYSDYLETIPAADKHNSFLLKEYYVTMYDDDNPDGVMLERAKVETPDPTPGDFGDPDEGRDPENNQAGGIDLDFGEETKNGCNSSVSAGSLLVIIPIIVAFAIAIIAKKRRNQQ